MSEEMVLGMLAALAARAAVPPLQEWLDPTARAALQLSLCVLSKPRRRQQRHPLAVALLPRVQRPRRNVRLKLPVLLHNSGNSGNSGGPRPSESLETRQPPRPGARLLAMPRHRQVQRSNSRARALVRALALLLILALVLASCLDLQVADALSLQLLLVLCHNLCRRQSPHRNRHASQTGCSGCQWMDLAKAPTATSWMMAPAAAAIPAVAAAPAPAPVAANRTASCGRDKDKEVLLRLQAPRRRGAPALLLNAGAGSAKTLLLRLAQVLLVLQQRGLSPSRCRLLAAVSLQLCQARPSCTRGWDRLLDCLAAGLLGHLAPPTPM